MKSIKGKELTFFRDLTVKDLYSTGFDNVKSKKNRRALA
jgi:hypothetical protein